jgi:hypothetical protein
MDILNNPFLKLLMKINPISWIIEAIIEETPGLQMPELAPILSGLPTKIGAGAEKQLDLMEQLMKTFFAEIQGAANDPTKFLDTIRRSLQSVVWTLFDTLRNIVETTYDIITAVISALSPMLEGVWKVPGLTDLWEDLTDQEFSLIGFMTYGPAVQRIS